MASTALSQQNHPDSLQQRMDQFLSMSAAAAAAAAAAAGREASEAVSTNEAQGNTERGRETPTSPPFVVGRDPYQYQDASVTSGSNSAGEEDDRDMTSEAGSKRHGGHLNGFASKKRRKQSKPIRIGSEHPQQPMQGGVVRETASSEDGRGQTSSPDEQGEYRRGSSADDDDTELEEGERRPGQHFMGEFPLNLSSSRDFLSGDKQPPMLRVLGAELLQHPDLDPSKFPGLGRPGSPSGIPASLYQSMLPFGLPPFPFPFPGQPSMKGPPGPGGQLIGPGGRSQIFNPEAYCELCNKEFCNKYFLKTHKANKHGIYSDSPGVSRSPGPPPPNTSSAGGPPGGPTPPITSSGQGLEHMGPPTPNSQAGSPFSGAFIAANMGSLRPPFLPLSPGASPSPTGGPQQRDRDTGILNNGREKEPGEITSHMSPRLSSSSSTGLMSPREALEFRQSMEERERLMQREFNRAEKENGELRKSLESPRPNSGGLNFNSMLFGGIPSIESLRKEDEMRKEAGLLANRQPLPNIPNVPNLQGREGRDVVGNGPIPKGPFTQEKLRQMGVINADAFCEICCKEFCNKYFLRVHKLKKHGICSPDLPPEKVQKILNQMAKEAGKTGNPPPPIIRPPSMMGSNEKMRSPSSLGLGPMPIRPPSGILSLPPLEPLLPQSLKDFQPMGGSPAMPPILDRPLGEDHRTANKEREIIRVNDDSEDGEQQQQQQHEQHLQQLHHQQQQQQQQQRDHDNESDARSRDSGSPDTTRDTSIGDRPSSPAGAGTEPSEDLQRLQSMIMELNSKQAKLHIPGAGIGGNDSVCKVCNKDMENKYFLRAHMMNEHGVLHMEEPSAAAAAAAAALAAGLPNLAMAAMDRERHNEDMMNGDFDSDQVDFATKFLQQMQKGLLPPLDGSGDERSFLERVKAELAASPKKLDKDPNRKPASLSRSYCEICKKELCNKYFMKTHMLKMHGINIEGGPPPPGLISTTGGSTGSLGGSNSNGPPSVGGPSVICQICKKELCSKYFLKVHLQNSHGLNEDGTPYTPSLKENGGLFAGLFPLTAPPPELLGLASSLPDSEHYFSRLLGEQSEISRERMKELEKNRGPGNNSTGASHTCSLCGEGFPEIVALQVHIIKSHGAFPPESGIFGGAAPGGSSGSLSPGEVERPGQRPDADGPSSGEQTPRGEHGDSEDKANKDSSSASTPVSSGMDNRPHQESGEKQQQQQQQLLAAAANDPAKHFSHIEMLQRHMLSQQFPGLINPLLSGFPGFQPGSGGLPFPNLQHLFGGNKKPEEEEEEEEGERLQTSGEGKTFNSTSSTSSSSPMKKNSNRKRFKCSKCSRRFPRRELCLRHIHAAHATTTSTTPRARSKLHFSPHKNLQSSKVRSHYVKQLMEMLRVPTSRGTPQKSPNQTRTEHIMQAFLLKMGPKPSNGSNDKSVDDDENHNEDNFVPSMVYLPVAKRISEPLTVAFSLTPA